MTDKKLTATALCSRYGAQHPKYVVFAWRAAVYECDTMLGYWDWVVFKIAQEPTKHTIILEVETTAYFDVVAAVNALKQTVSGNPLFTGIIDFTYHD